MTTRSSELDGDGPKPPCFNPAVGGSDIWRWTGRLQCQDKEEMMKNTAMLSRERLAGMATEDVDPINGNIWLGSNDLMFWQDQERNQVHG